MITTLDTDLNIIQGLDDEPNDVTGITSDQLKIKFDQASNSIKDYINNVLIPDLIAANIPISEITDLNSLFIQDAIAELKGISDDNKEYLLQICNDNKQYLADQLQGVVLGQLPDGSLTDIKLSNADGQIKDNFAKHIVDMTKHLPTGAITGQVLQKQEVGYGFVDLPPSKDADNGRYQSDFSLDSVILNMTKITNGIVDLDYAIGSTATRVQDTASSSYPGKSGLKVHINAGYNPIGIKFVLSSLAVGCTKAYVLNSSKSVLLTIDITGKTSSDIINIVYNFLSNTDYYIAVDGNGSSFMIGNATVTYPYTSTEINITGGLNNDNDTTTTGCCVYSVATIYSTKTGTVVKTISPSDIKKWGNVKWVQTTVASGSTIVCNVYKSDGTTLLLSNITSIADLSSIDFVVNPIINVKWTLTRLLVTDTSPTISNVSVTWEGELPPNDYNIGNGVIYSDATSTACTSGTYIKAKELQLLRGGDLRICFSLTGGTPSTIYAQIYRNGIPIGIERLNPTYIVAFSEDIKGWKANDLLQIYIKRLDSTFSVSFSLFLVKAANIDTPLKLL